MKGKRKRGRFKSGNQGYLLRRSSLTTNENESKLAPPTSHTDPSTQVSPNGQCDLNSPVSTSQKELPKSKSMWLPRLSVKDFHLYAKQSYDGKSYTDPVVNESCNALKLLRPIKLKDDYLDEYLDDSNYENLIVDKFLTLDMINNLYRTHINDSPSCSKPHFDLIKEVPWGLGWVWTLKCTNCTYISEPYKLYHEIKEGKVGRKAAATNYAFQTGVINTNIGVDSARLIMTSAGIKPMSRSGMHRVANIVNDKVLDLAEQESQKVIKRFKTRNETLGLQKNHPIKLQMDGTYQSVTIKGRHKMGQSASQSIGVACEIETDDKDVVAWHFSNKLCWVGAWLRGLGYDVECPDHENCTANTDQYEPLSEKTLGYEIGKIIGKQDLLVDYCTTDGDSSSVVGLDIAMKELFGPLWSVSRQADTIHRGQSQFRQGLKAKFSAGMFPGSTKAQKRAIQIAFSDDLKLRSYGIMKSLFIKHNGDIHKISRQLPRVVNSVVKCYSGFCGDTCRWSPTLCQGGKKTSWWYKSINLSSHGLTNGSLKPNDNDKRLIAELLEMKLSVGALEQMRFFSNTNKCEYVNKVISSCLPKNKNFSRNATGRTAAAILKVNHKTDVAIAKSLKAVGCPLSKTNRAVVELKNIRKRYIYNKSYQRQTTVILRRLQARKKQAIKFLLHQSKRQGDYKKHKLEPKLHVHVSKTRSQSPQPGCSHW